MKPRERQGRKAKLEPRNGRMAEAKNGKAGSLPNVSEQQRAEEALLQNEGTTRALLESATQGILAIDGQGSIVLANRAAEQMFGYETNELLGNPLEILLPERLRRVHNGHVASYRLDSRARAMGLGLELEARRKDGTTFPVEIGLSSVGSGEGKLSVAFVSDITERKRLYTALYQSTQEVKMLLDNSPDVIIRKDLQGRYRYINAMGVKMAGRPAEDILGRTPREIGVPEEVCQLSDNALRTVVNSGRPTVEEWSYLGPSTETIWEARICPEFNAASAVQSVLYILRDITEQRHLEREAEVRQKEIVALAGSLLTAQEEERRRVSRELHDQICQQLASLAMEIGGLATEPRAPESIHGRLKELQSRAIKASEQTRHIAHELHPSELDDLGLVASLESACREFSRRAHIATTFKKAALPASVSREVGSCLYRVAQESLQNVAKHAHATHVWVRLTLKTHSVVLSIADDGAGFDVEAVRGRGGLGLLGMEERARLVKGTLSIKAPPGKGSRIVIEVPLGAAGL